MAQSEHFGDLISSLSAEERETVQAFIEFLRRNAASKHPDTFQAALESFVQEHEELLRRLAR